MLEALSLAKGGLNDISIVRTEVSPQIYSSAKVIKKPKIFFAQQAHDSDIFR